MTPQPPMASPTARQDASSLASLKQSLGDVANDLQHLTFHLAQFELLDQSAEVKETSIDRFKIKVGRRYSEENRWIDLWAYLTRPTYEHQGGIVPKVIYIETNTGSAEIYPVKASEMLLPSVELRYEFSKVKLRGQLANLVKCYFFMHGIIADYEVKISKDFSNNMRLVIGYYKVNGNNRDTPENSIQDEVFEIESSEIDRRHTAKRRRPRTKSTAPLGGHALRGDSSIISAAKVTVRIFSPHARIFASN
jgi:hypothetical protein